MALRHAAQARRRPRSFVLTVGIVLATAGAVNFFGCSQQQDVETVAPPKGVRTFDVEGGHSDLPVEYDVTPPVGGKHDPLPQTCAFYAEPVRSEHAVHSLEHGAVWITYRRGLADDQIDILRGLAETSAKVLVSEWRGDLPATVVASAWGRQLRLRSARDDRLVRFIDVFQSATTAPEPAARCGGVGQPLA